MQPPPADPRIVRREAAALTVLACLCRAQSPQEQALARQRESIAIQQASFRQPDPPSLHTRQQPAAWAFSANLPDTGSGLQQSSIQKQLVSIGLQHNTAARSSRSLRETAIDPAAQSVLPSSAASPDPAPGAPPASAPPPSQPTALELQLRSAGLQPRPAWPEPPSAASLLACVPLTSSALSPLFQRAAEAYGLAPSLLRAVAEKESSLRPCAVSPAGALGLMQLMPETASWLGVTDPFDVEQNVFGAARFLRFLLDRFNNDLGLALGAYNAGPGRIDHFGGIPPIPETQDYVAGILSRLRAAAAERTR